VKYKGKTIADLGRTIDPQVFSARGEKLPIPVLREVLADEEQDFREHLIKTIVGLTAHHPTKEELEESLAYLDDFLEDVANTYKGLGIGRVLLDLADSDDVDIELK
jgi:hypothetical protein